MFPPCEMMAKFFLPAVRGIVVHRLRRRGIGQPTIARLVGTTQPAVSQILSKEESRYLGVLERMGVERSEATTLADTLCDVLRESPSQAAGLLYSFWRSLLSEGRLCSFHRSMYPQLADCEICMNVIAETWLDGEKMTVLKRLENAVKKLEETPNIHLLIPQVGSNMVYSLKTASSISDVAGVAGRIVAVDRRVKSVGRPSFGGSRHLAGVLLRVRGLDQSVRSAVNLRYGADVEKGLKNLGLPYAVVEPRTRPVDEEEVIQDVERCFREGRVRAVLHGGGVGYEPITYIFGKTPDDIVETVVKLLAKIFKT
ncbi:MAG: thiamine-phosphate synthase family protein [Candidatus Caldarchaeum sp.]|nr:thiamine-phosphate synthase family protein [Candidatus Caldarchaeum sp.]